MKNSADHSHVDSSRRALSTMSYDMIASMNTPRNVNPMNGMAMSQSSTTMNLSRAAMPVSTGLERVQPSGSNANPYSFMPRPAAENFFIPTNKEVIQLTRGVLYPPNPNAPRPTTRGKPPGCKTVFVGGLPEKITEEIMKDIFEKCGPVEVIRMSKKNFCHIRFLDEICVDNAIRFSGYRLKIENKDEPAYTGRLLVDYGMARNDQYEWLCKQRSLQRQAPHKEQEYFRSVTPSVVHYTEHEASLVCEKLKSEETFPQAASILVSWLERGECTKKNCGTFYSMIQSTHNHVRKLQADKFKYEEQLNEAKKMLRKQLEGIIRQFTTIGKIFKAASLQRSWDHFSKPQRKNIEIWKKQTEELKNAHLEEVINEREDEEMELSDDEGDENKKTVDVEQLKNQMKEDIHKLQEECDSLKCQLEASRNEIMVMQSDFDEEMKKKDEQLSDTRQALQASKKEVLNLSQKRSKDEADLKDHRSFKMKRRDGDVDDGDLAHDSSDAGLGACASSSVGIVENEANLIGLICTFLNVHPFGANIDYIVSYLHQIDSSIQVRDVENLMKRFPKIFIENSTGIGASLGKKWYYKGLEK